MHNLRTAIGFLTRIPISTPKVVLAEAAPWFPVVGLGIGLVQAAALLAFHELLPPGPAVVLAVALAALITGAFHHDGLADMADAFGGGWDVEQRLRIMKDSRLGTYGTTALILAFATEIATLAALAPQQGARAVVAAHCLSRALAVAAMRLAPLAPSPMTNQGATEAQDTATSQHATSPDTEDNASPTEDRVETDDGVDGIGEAKTVRAMGGLGAAYAQDLTAVATLAAVAIGLAATAAAFIGSLTALVAVPLAVVAALAVVVLSVRKIGGFTGDVLGAIQQLSYLGVLVAAAL